MEIKVRHFYTSAEYNQLYADSLKQRKYQDDWGRKIINDLITEKADKIEIQKVKFTSDKYYCDLLYTLKNKDKLAVEVKYRFQDPIACGYKDHLINCDKFASFIKNREDQKIAGGHLLSIWSQNGEIWQSNIFDPNATTEQRWQNKTTNGYYDGQKELKWCKIYKPMKIWYFCYFYDPDDNEWSVIFDQKPLDVKQLEYEYNRHLEQSMQLF